MRVQVEEPQDLGLPACERVLQRPEVAEGLVHLLPAHHEHPAVHPHVDERLDARERLRLRDLGLVVGEHELRRAAVDVVPRPEMPDRDRRVLDVPPGPALAPGAVPRRLAGLLRLPEREVRGVALALIHGDARPRDVLLDLLAAELPPVRVPRRVVVHAAVLRRVREPFPDEPLDLLEDLRHVVRRVRVQVHGGARETRHPVEVLADELLHEVLPAPAGLVHPVDEAVLDVRDVLQVEHVVSLAPEVPRDDVERDVRLRVPDVRRVVRRDAADEHRDAAAVEGNEVLLPPRECVVHPDRHRRGPHEGGRY